MDLDRTCTGGGLHRSSDTCMQEGGFPERARRGHRRRGARLRVGKGTRLRLVRRLLPGAQPPGLCVSCAVAFGEAMAALGPGQAVDGGGQGSCLRPRRGYQAGGCCSICSSEGSGP